jgi:hypothetical protein
MGKIFEPALRSVEEERSELTTVPFQYENDIIYLEKDAPHILLVFGRFNQRYLIPENALTFPSTLSITFMVSLLDGMNWESSSSSIHSREYAIYWALKVLLGLFDLEQIRPPIQRRILTLFLGHHIGGGPSEVVTDLLDINYLGKYLCGYESPIHKIPVKVSGLYCVDLLEQQ